jgi:membrane protein implicated in regulation of membrane protease activity
MNWNASTLWWLAAGVLVAAELASGTFYLLMLALGAAAGALAAHAGLNPTTQIVAAALVGAAATGAWHWNRRKHPHGPPLQGNRDINLDIGEHVQVTAWDNEGNARVHYRGAAWSARHAGHQPPVAGQHRIVAVDGNRLVLAPVEPHKPQH